MQQQHFKEPCCQVISVLARNDSQGRLGCCCFGRGRGAILSLLSRSQLRGDLEHSTYLRWWCEVGWGLWRVPDQSVPTCLELLVKDTLGHVPAEARPATSLEFEIERTDNNSNGMSFSWSWLVFFTCESFTTQMICPCCWLSQLFHWLLLMI